MTKGRVRPLVSFTAIWMFAGCAATIAQDAKSGPDAKSKGAKKIRLSDDGEGSAKGIVTYPGGDRVDWKVFEIPKKGDVEIALKWTPPRPGEDLAFNVLDDTFHVVRRVAPTPDTGKTKKTAELTGVEAGKYYVQVYAPERGDAGEYEVNVKYTVGRVGPVVTNLEPLANPPRLPAVPGAPATAGGGGGAPSGPKGSKGNPCMANEIAKPECQAPTALFLNPACPNVDPMPMGAPCPQQPVINPACPDAGPLMPGAPCPFVAQKKQAKIIERQIAGNEVIITLDKGQNQGITKGWTGIVFKGKTGTTPLGKSEFVIIDVKDNESHARVKLPLDTLSEKSGNVRVELTQPPPK